MSSPVCKFLYFLMYYKSVGCMQTFMNNCIIIGKSPLNFNLFITFVCKLSDAYGM